MKYTDSLFKYLLRVAYKLFCNTVVLVNIFLPKNSNVSVYYSGAFMGDVGGPLVKVKRLNSYFPQKIFFFNLIYSLSNTSYIYKTCFYLLKLKRVPIVHNQNGVFYKGWFKGDWVKQNKKISFAYHAADYVFYQSKFCKDAADRFLGIRKGNGEILYNAVDTKLFLPSKSKYNNKSKGKVKIPFVFLITGKINNHLYYRLESTILGIAYANKKGFSFELHIAGWIENEALTKAISLCQSYNIQDKVFFLGKYSQEEAPNIYRRADAYITTKHNDPCPNAVIEAMSCGLPILYSNTGGVPELVGNHAGIPLQCRKSWTSVYSPNTRSIAEGMVEIFNNHRKFSLEARKRAVEKFDINLWILRHDQIFKNLLNEYQNSN